MRNVGRKFFNGENAFLNSFSVYMLVSEEMMLYLAQKLTEYFVASRVDRLSLSNSLMREKMGLIFFNGIFASFANFFCEQPLSCHRNALKRSSVIVRGPFGPI